MAVFGVNGLKDIQEKLSRLSQDAGNVAKEAVYAGAGVVADQIRANLRRVLSGQSTGDLEASLGITPISMDNKMVWNAKVGFDGYDSKGVPNQLKANVLESGSSRQPKRPFVRTAVTASRKRAVEAMERVVDEAIEKITR